MKPDTLKLLPEAKAQDSDKICVVIDLDETLVHSSFKPVNNADFIIPVEIDGVVHQVYVLKRPHVDEFLAVAEFSRFFNICSALICIRFLFLSC